jgi:hypothetical protein
MKLAEAEFCFILVPLLVEEICFSETSVDFHQATLLRIPEDRPLHVSTVFVWRVEESRFHLGLFFRECPMARYVED